MLDKLQKLNQWLDARVIDLAVLFTGGWTSVIWFQHAGIVAGLVSLLFWGYTFYRLCWNKKGGSL